MADSTPTNEPPIDEDLQTRLGRIKLAIFDIDGVLTDGRLYYGSGGVETKAFHAQDGAALKMCMGVGLPVAVITGRKSEAATRRMEELGVTHFFDGAAHKEQALEELILTLKVEPDAMSHAGDDIPDLVLFDRVGVRFSVPDAHPEVIARADYVTTARAGHGAVREICTLILKAQNLWNTALERAR